MRHTILIKPLPLIEVCLQKDDSLLLKTAKKVFSGLISSVTRFDQWEKERDGL